MDYNDQKYTGLEEALLPSAMRVFKSRQAMTQPEAVKYPERVSWSMPEDVVYGQPLQLSFSAWLKSLGFSLDPFVILDAGKDPELPKYLVDHANGDNGFEKLWGDWPTFMFAPAGGGKTAFRVRLTRACRMREDGRRVFPVIYHRLPTPDQIADDTRGRDIHLKHILQQSAQELLFQLAYRPLELNEIGQATLITIRRVLDANLPSSLDSYLERIGYFGDLSPLTNEFDPTASYLSNPPGPKDLALFCRRLQGITSEPISNQSLTERFEELAQLVLESLHYEALFLLVDGVDAYPETIAQPAEAISILNWLLNNVQKWAARQIFVKFFLPDELTAEIGKRSQLTPYVKIGIIEWSMDSLCEIIRRRLGVASDGLFDSLDVISNPGLRSAEETLARAVRPRVPREVLMLTERLLVEHVRRCGARGKLESRDLKSALAWYATQATAPPR
jgi:hypothetical protein